MGSNFVWNSETTGQLIYLYEEAVPLWDSRHPDYINIQKRADFHNAIGEVLGCSGAEVRIQIRNLRVRFLAELRKIKAAKLSGANTNEPLTSNWEHYHNLKFMENSIISMPTIFNSLKKETGIESIRLDSLLTPANSSLTQSSPTPSQQPVPSTSGTVSAGKRKRDSSPDPVDVGALTNTKPLEVGWQSIGSITTTHLHEIESLAIREKLSKKILKLVFKYKAKDRAFKAATANSMPPKYYCDCKYSSSDDSD